MFFLSLYDNALLHRNQKLKQTSIDFKKKYYWLTNLTRNYSIFRFNSVQFVIVCYNTINLIIAYTFSLQSDCNYIYITACRQFRSTAYKKKQVIWNIRIRNNIAIKNNMGYYVQIYAAQNMSCFIFIALRFDPRANSSNCLLTN